VKRTSVSLSTPASRSAARMRPVSWSRNSTIRT
jgi:hypothetical protein